LTADDVSREATKLLRLCGSHALLIAQLAATREARNGRRGEANDWRRIAVAIRAVPGAEFLTLVR
jgi:hypothetical protein